MTNDQRCTMMTKRQKITNNIQREKNDEKAL